VVPPWTHKVRIFPPGTAFSQRYTLHSDFASFVFQFGFAMRQLGWQWFASHGSFAV
jgi:hypothetical protein